MSTAKTNAPYVATIKRPGIRVSVELSSLKNLRLFERLITEIRYDEFPFTEIKPVSQLTDTDDLESTWIDFLTTDEEIEKVILSGWVADLSKMADGELIEVKAKYLGFAKMREENKPIPLELVAGPADTYPAKVWHRCVEYIDSEMATRMMPEGGSDD